MSRTKEIFAILDTETTFENRAVYNIGYIIINSSGYPIHSREMLLTDALESDRPFYSGKIPKTAQRMVTERALGTMMADFEDFGVTTICAYNAQFDVRAIRNAGLDLTENFQIFDLWSAASVTICNATYIKWALRHGKVTEKDNVKTSAEVVYQYISKLTDFEEDHTALSDCWIELEIWRTIRRKKVKMAELENQSHPWRIVAELRSELGLQPRFSFYGKNWEMYEYSCPCMIIHRVAPGGCDPLNPFAYGARFYVQQPAYATFSLDSQIIYHLPRRLLTSFPTCSFPFLSYFIRDFPA